MKLFVEDTVEYGETVFKANSLKKIVEYLIEEKNENLLPHNGYMNGCPYEKGESYDSLYEKNKFLLK